MLRDISATELHYMLEIIGYEEIVLSEPPEEDTDSDEGRIWVTPISRNAELLSGLVSLGILVPTKGGAFGTLHYRFSPVAEHLNRLVSS